MTEDEAIRDQRAFRGVLVSAVITVLAAPFTVAAGLGVRGMPWWPPVAAAMVALVVATALVIRRRHENVRLAAIGFVAIACALAASYWIYGAHFMASGLVVVAFEARKLVTVVVPLVAPNLWSGLVAIIVLIGGAILQYFALPPEALALVPVSEPWAMCAFGLLSIAMHVHQQRQRAVELAMVRNRAETRALARIARSFIAMRDLMNTPLQTIQLTAATLRLRAPVLAPLVDRIDRALAQLHELGAILDRYRSRLVWSEHESFDAKGRLT